MLRVLGLLTALMLVGCQTRPPKVEVVEVPGPTRYVEIPDEMTRPCPIEEKTNNSPLEAVRVAKARKDALEACNRDKARIRAIQGTEP